MCRAVRTKGCYICVIHMKGHKEPLYRKYNKVARGFHHNAPGGEYRYERNSKAMNNFEATHKSIHRTRAGYDYTPLFRFLLSKVGQNWDDVFSEAVSRLDKQEPVFWLVDLNLENNDDGVVRIGEHSYYSKLTVKDGLLTRADEAAEAPAKSCTCCTHTFNGKPY